MTEQVKAQFGKDLQCLTGIEFLFPSGLSVRKVSDGHKRPKRGGPTKAWVDFEATLGTIHKEFTLFMCGTEGKTENQRFTSEDLGEFRIELRPGAHFRVIEVGKTAKESHTL